MKKFILRETLEKADSVKKLLTIDPLNVLDLLLEHWL